MASFLSQFRLTRTKDEARYASVYINKQGLSIAVTPDRFEDRLTVEYLQYIPFEENPTPELINYILGQYVKDNNLKGTFYQLRALKRIIPPHHSRPTRQDTSR